MSEVRCANCGSDLTDFQVRYRRSTEDNFLSCCPERKPLDIDEWKAKADAAEAEIARLEAIVRVNGLRWGHSHAEIDALIGTQPPAVGEDVVERAAQIIYEAEYDREAYPWSRLKPSEQFSYITMARSLAAANLLRTKDAG